MENTDSSHFHGCFTTVGDWPPALIYCIVIVGPPLLDARNKGTAVEMGPDMASLVIESAEKHVSLIHTWFS